MPARSRSICRKRRLGSIVVVAAISLFSRVSWADNESPKAPPAAAYKDPSLDVTVRAPPRKRAPAEIRVRAEEARQAPGTRDDALAVIESLPGVARAPFAGGQVLLWGAAAGDSGLYIDGVEVPSLYHEGGFRGVIPSDLVRSIDLSPGAFGASFGRAIGGVVQVATRDLPAKEGVFGSFRTDLLDASALAGFSTGKLRVAVAGRAGYLDRIAAAVAPRASEVLPIPRYHDVQMKLSLALREDEELMFVLLGSGDAIDRRQRSSDPAELKSEHRESSFYRAYLRYRRVLEDGTAIEVTPFIGRDRSTLRASFGSVPQEQDNASWKYGLRASARLPLGERVILYAGIDALATRSALTRQGSINLPPREGDLYVFGQPPGAGVNADAWSAVIACVAPYVGADVRVGPVTLSPGLRAEGVLIEASRGTPRAGDTPRVGVSRLAPAIDPRLSVTWAASRDVLFAAAGGLYQKPPAPEDLSAVFGTPALGLARAVHASASCQIRLPLGFEAEVTTFYRHLDRLVVRSRLPAPPLAQSLTQDGEGRSFGAQVLVRRELKNGLYGWIAYTASRSERRYRGDARYRLFDHDQPHVLTVVAGYTWRGLGAGARFRYAKGAPRTPVVGSFYEASSGVFQPIFGAQSSARLPDFYALDLRAQYAFSVKRATVNVYLDVLNVTNHKNGEEVVYNFDFSKKGLITGLPILAVVGAGVSL